MKLLYITNGVAGSGGLERVLSIKASYLAENLGYQVHIITLNEENLSHFFEFSSKINYHNIVVNGNAFTYTLVDFRSVNRIILKRIVAASSMIAALIFGWTIKNAMKYERT